MYHSIEQRGYKVMHDRYEVARGGLDLFATFVLDFRMDGRSLMMGARNSNGKRFGAGAVGGFDVMVCSNLCFFGEYIEMKRHTVQMSKELLYAIAMRAVVGAEHQATDLNTHMDMWRGHKITTDELKMITYDLLNCEVLPPSKFRSYLDCVDEEFKLDKDLSVYTAYQGATRLLRGSSINQQQQISGNLNSLMDSYAGISSTPVSEGEPDD